MFWPRKLPKIFHSDAEMKNEHDLQTVVIDYAPRANTTSDKIEETANDMARQGWELTAFSVTNSAKAILAFRTAQ